MKKRKISFFDLGLCLLVLVLGLAAYRMSHGDPPPSPTSADTLVEDIQRNSRRYTNVEMLLEQEHYVLHYQTALDTDDLEAISEIISVGDTLYNSFNMQPLGTLTGIERMDVDGVQRVVLSLETYSVTTKTSAQTPSGNNIRVGEPFYLAPEDGQDIGLSEIFWISH